MTKQPSLRDLASRKKPSAATTTAEPVAAGEPRARAKSPRGKTYKGVLSKVDSATWKQLKNLSTELEVPITDLQIEALNLLFKKHGRPEIAARWQPGE
jgi:hypothetical protein